MNVCLITPELTEEMIQERFEELKCYINKDIQSHSLADSFVELIKSNMMLEEFYHDGAVLKVNINDKDPNIPEWQANLMSSGVINKYNSNRRK